MKHQTLALGILVVLFSSSWCLLAQESQEIENVAAFARLYGVVRFFYPSDTAAAANWNRIAVEGVARVRTSPDAAALADRLRRSFARLGPGIEIARELQMYQPPAAANEPLVAWRYLGAGVSNLISGSPYAGKRTNRTRNTAGAIVGFAGFAQFVPADGLRANTVRLRGKARATSHDGVGGGALWLRVDGPQGQRPTCFDNMSDRLVQDENWREYVLQCRVSDDATNVAFGVMAVGAVTADFDELELAVLAKNSEWRAQRITDGGFEAANAAAWSRVGSANAQVTWPTDGAPEGRQFVRFAPAEPAASPNELFPDAPPSIADHVDVDLGSGLKARVSLSLSDTQARAGVLGDDAPNLPTSVVDERLADIVVAWNVYRHFYPYLADAGVDWDARLRPQLQRAYSATDRASATDALRRLVADARDGHGRVTDLRERSALTSVPLRFASVDSRIVVVASRAADVPLGSVISTIDGVAATDRFSTAMETISGSEQWRQSRAADEIGICATGSPSHIGIETATANKPRMVELACEPAGLMPLERRPPQIAELSPGVWYVDLTRAKNADLVPVVATLAAAKGVIFDLRGYPTESGAWVLPHLIEQPENDRWMHVAKITGPFGRSAGWQDVGWNLKPAAPKFPGKIVFLTDGRAISYAESVMGYIGDRHLATIVGSTTAGTNGNIAAFQVPGGFTITFTGMRVTGHDGRAVHHLIGIHPDIAVAPTIAGVREGRDDVLARAVSLIQ